MTAAWRGFNHEASAGDELGVVDLPLESLLS